MDGLAEYRKGWQETMEMLRGGKSFSGHERNSVFLNCQNERFANASAPSGLDFDDDGRAVCLVDWDQDGDLDIWFHNRTAPRLRLMRNRLRDSAESAGNHYITIGLQGTTSNRDAIGTRVTIWLTNDVRPISKTLRAGDGFLSQSSKWLHFGLGDNDSIERVDVRWPNGSRMTYRRFVANSRYQLTEGNEVPEKINLPTRHLAIDDSPQPDFKSITPSRTVLPNRIPVPLLPYETLPEREERTVQPGNKASLILLWASWCPTCKEELKRLQSHEKELARHGVTPFLISVDGLDDQHPINHLEVGKATGLFQPPFEIGIAKRECIEKIRIVESVLFNRPPKTAVPLGLLLDGEGSLAVVYRGPVDFDQLLDDVNHLSDTPSQRREQSVPFAGTWQSGPKQLLLRAVGQLFADNGFDEDHARYLQLDTEMLQRRRRSAKSAAARELLNAEYASANYNLGVALVARNEDARAFEFFEQAVEANPDHCDATVNLAVLYAKRRDIRKAVELLHKAIEINPDSFQARANLANAMSAGGAFGKSIPHYQHLISIGKANASIHARLARSLIETGNVSDAAIQLDTAFALGANDIATLSTLAWIRATALDESVRDGEQAEELAGQISASGPLQRAMILDISSASKAERGEFVQAIALAEQALESLGNRQPQLRRKIESRIKNYQESQPVRDADGKYP